MLSITVHGENMPSFFTAFSNNEKKKKHMAKLMAAIKSFRLCNMFCSVEKVGHIFNADCDYIQQFTLQHYNGFAEAANSESESY